METNACVFYNEVTEVYEKLLLFCTSNGFKVRENDDKFYFINISDFINPTKYGTSTGQISINFMEDLKRLTYYW